MASSLDIEQTDQLRAYLRARGHVGVDEVIAVTPLTGGVSNRTVLVERESGEAWVLKQALARLRVEVEWTSDPRRIEREAEGMRALAELLPSGSVPRLLFEDKEHHLLAMEAVPHPHTNWKEMLLAGRVERDHVVQFGRMLGAIHRGSMARAADLAPRFADRAFFESLRLEPYYGYSARQQPRAADFLLDLMAETRTIGVALVHGDYSPKNILVRAGQLVLLDHEVIHWGDPAFDIGFSLTHLLSKAHHRPEQRDAFLAAAEAHWQSYRLVAGPGNGGFEARCARHTLACLLARVDGRSPLEYLGEAERRRQRGIVLSLMAAPLASPIDLIGAWSSALG